MASTAPSATGWPSASFPSGTCARANASTGKCSVGPSPAKRVLVINVGWEQERLVRVLAEYGVEIYAISSVAGWNRELPVKEAAQMDYRDLPAVLDYARRVRPAAVVADQCDYSYFAAA